MPIWQRNYYIQLINEKTVEKNKQLEAAKRRVYSQSKQMQKPKNIY